MDINTIVSLIGSIGFPIIMCLIMVKYIQDLNNQYMTTIKVLTDNYHDDVEQLCETVANNTAAINMLLNKIGGK